MKQFEMFVRVCSLLAELCTALLLHALNVLVMFSKPKKLLTRVCSGDCYLRLRLRYLFFTRANYSLCPDIAA